MSSSLVSTVKKREDANGINFNNIFNAIYRKDLHFSNVVSVRRRIELFHILFFVVSRENPVGCTFRPRVHSQQPHWSARQLRAAGGYIVNSASSAQPGCFPKASLAFLLL